MDLDFGSSLAESDLGEDFIRRRSRSEYGRTRRESGDVWGWKGARQRSVSRLSQRPEKERMARIERENHILLQKILDCHLGVDRKRTSKIPQSRGRYSGEFILSVLMVTSFLSLINCVVESFCYLPTD